MCPWARLSVQHCCSLGLMGDPARYLPSSSTQCFGEPERPQGSGKTVRKGCAWPGEGGMCCALGLETFEKDIHQAAP